MDARKFLQTVGSEVGADFAKKRSILSFEEYLQLFHQSPKSQLRNAAGYLKDAIDSFGTEQVPHPTGQIRRFKIFDLIPGEREGRVAGQEEVQNAIYRILGNFVRTGRINKLILLHGPNGSAKSSLVEGLKRGTEAYSHTPDGALYSFNWIFPTEKLVKGSIGFGEKTGGGTTGSLLSFAHLEPENIELKITNAMHEHPLFLIPRPERKALIDQAVGAAPSKGEFIVPAYLLEGELTQKSRKIYEALLSGYEGDWLKVLRHVQVERFYVSRRYQVATVTVEPQMSVDAGIHQVTPDKMQMSLPPQLQGVALFEPSGALVSANRGLIEYSDLLKRPLEAFKYLLGASETGEVPLDQLVLQLDEVLIASSNEKHLAAFKEIPDFASFKGRIELVRVPYVRRWKVEREIYDAQVNERTVGRHVAPHATRVAAMWAVLTRLKKPIADRYPTDARPLIERLSPLEKLALYQDGAAPDRLSMQQAKELKRQAAGLYEESDAYPNYEGRSGASAREIKTALFNAAQSPEHDCLHPLAVLKELHAICRDKSVYEFLQQEVVDGYHDHEEFVRVVENDYLDQVDHEVRDSMGLVSDRQYQELFERYVQLVNSWVKGEKMANKVTGQAEKPDEGRMAEFEGYVMPKGEDAADFRKGLISSIGAHKIENPDAAVDYTRIFPDLFKRLRDHFFEERKRQLGRNVENILKFLSDDKGQLSAKEQTQVRQTLDTLGKKYGYTDTSARDAVVFLMRKRYA
jgi:serine protein kinase